MVLSRSKGELVFAQQLKDATLALNKKNTVP